MRRQAETGAAHAGGAERCGYLVRAGGAHNPHAKRLARRDQTDE